MVLTCLFLINTIYIKNNLRPLILFNIILIFLYSLFLLYLLKLEFFEDRAIIDHVIKFILYEQLSKR